MSGAAGTQQLEAIVKLALERVLAREGRCPPAASAGASPQPSPSANPEARSLKPEARPPEPASRPAEPMTPPRARGEVAIGSDHGGFELKQELIRFLRDVGYRLRDVGTYSTDAVDYPDFALQVAAAVAKGDAWRGIMIDGVGVGSGMAANKVPGIRAAVCFDVFSTRNAREHNDANVMCIGGRVLDVPKAREMARIFLETEFGGDRHLKRVNKIVGIERMFLDAAAGRAR